MASIAQIDQGEFCELVTNVHPHQKNMWYDYTVEVRGGVIDTSINGVPLPQARACQPVIEPLYAAASVEDATGDVIVKVVNLRDAAAQVTLDLDSFHGEQVEVYRMAGFARTDRNSFEAPEKVAPTVTTLPAIPADWVFPAESLTVLRFKASKEENQ